MRKAGVLSPCLTRALTLMVTWHGLVVQDISEALGVVGEARPESLPPNDPLHSKAASCTRTHGRAHGWGGNHTSFIGSTPRHMYRSEELELQSSSRIAACNQSVNQTFMKVYKNNNFQECWILLKIHEINFIQKCIIYDDDALTATMSHADDEQRNNV